MSMTMRDGPGKIVVLGALSAIAEAAAREWAAQGAQLLLVARDGARLEAVAADLRIRGATRVEIGVSDLAACDAGAAFRDMTTRLGGIDVVLLAYGVLGDQGRAEGDLEEVAKLLQVNFTSAALWSLAAADFFEKQGRGTLIVIGSVAGDRGRASNYIYGAAKGGLGILVQGIAHRLARSGARAILVKPGFVDTPMTAHIAGKGAMWAKPVTIGRIIANIGARTDSTKPVVYAPGFWRWIMLVIRGTPAAIFHKTRL